MRIEEDGVEIRVHPAPSLRGLQVAGMVVVADGSDRAEAKLDRVLTTDPGTGVIRHVDAGYGHAVDIARERGVVVPMLPE